MITETRFFHKFPVLEVRHDCADGGDYLLLHPEQIDEVIEFISQGYRAVSVHESIHGNMVDTTQPCDFGEAPYKIGYYIINNENLTASL